MGSPRRWSMPWTFVSVVVALWPAPCARAWTPQIAPRLDQGAPLDGDENVPTDVVPFYFEADGSLMPSLRWTDSEGNPVAFKAARDFVQYVDLVPEQPLQPNTTYTIHATWTLASREVKEDELSFTTGDGPYQGDVQLPELALTSYVFSKAYREAQASCGVLSSLLYLEPRGTCLLVRDPDRWTEVTLIDELGQERWDKYRRHGSSPVPMGVDDSPSTGDVPCADVRARAPNGARSEPTRLCLAEFPLRTIEDDDTPLCPAPEQWGTPKEAALEANEASDDYVARSECAETASNIGCSAAPASRRRSRDSLGLLLATALFLGARRRGRRAPGARRIG